MAKDLSGFTIRAAKPNDCQDIVDLSVELAVYEKEDPSRVKINKETLMRDGFGDKPWFRCLIAEFQDSSVSTNEKIVVGYALFFPTYSTWDGRTMKIEDLYIKPDYRGKGYGSALLKEVTRLALEDDCQRVHWLVLDWNQTAIDFYRKIGADYQPEWRQCTLHRHGMLKNVSHPS